VHIYFATSTPPSITAKQSGSIYFSNNWTKHFEQFGASSEGLRTTALPAAMADPTYGKLQAYGKFHGPSTSTTPNGSGKKYDLPGWSPYGVSTGIISFHFLKFSSAKFISSLTGPVE